MKLMQFVLGCAVVALVNGCGTTTGLSPRTAHSGFDNARTVSVAPHGNISAGLSGTSTGIGAQWSEAHKDQAILIVAAYLTYTAITGAELNIDGEKVRLTPTATATSMESSSGVKMSTKAFLTELATVEKIIKSKRTWLRLHTPEGSIEGAVIDGDKDSKAYHALIRFMDAVKGTKKG
jgi:hypothetical protein